MDGHRFHAGWAGTTLVLSLIGPAMVSRAGVWFVAGTSSSLLDRESQAQQVC